MKLWLRRTLVHLWILFGFYRSGDWSGWWQ